MAALDAKARALALKLIDKNGMTVSYVHRTSVSAYNPATSKTEPVTVTVSVKAYINFPNLKDIQAGVLVDEKTCLIAASAIAFEPKALDKVVFDGVTYTVRPVSGVYSGEQVALWFVAIKRS